MAPATDCPAIPINGPQGLPPRIFRAGEHPITLKLIDHDALYVLRKLNASGFSGYLVGGGVRDLYLGKTPKDFDISTDARPGQIRKLFPNSTVIGRRFRLVQVFFPHGKIIEISTLRSLSEHDLEGPEAILAPNNTFGTVAEDAQRRDLTINGLFFDIRDLTIIDYVDGVQDLDNAVIRMIGDPERRIHRDPVRMIRAIRHAARNNFRIEEQTWKAICDNHQMLQHCPPSRLRDELLKDLYSGHAAAWLQSAIDSGIFLALFPLYQKTFSRPPESKLHPRAHLLNLLRILDRINRDNGVTRSGLLPDYFLLTLLLIPWVESRYHIFSQQFNGSSLFQVAKRIRDDIDREIGIQLNLRRSLRQEATSMLTNLSLLIQHRKNESWPKWLKNKNYFSRTSLLYSCYMEATFDIPSLDDHSDLLPQVSEEPPQSPLDRDKYRRGRPAFAPKAKGGVFGFKK
ncbi:MAG: polya polymerase [Desulfobulbaceae bacterium]|nr:MAG: polya polymerase [Desulfobulbaceae bacterium]